MIERSGFFRNLRIDLSLLVPDLNCTVCYKKTVTFGLDLLSNSHAAVVNGRAFEFETIRIVITSERLIDKCLPASFSILCGIHSADETQSG